MTLALANRGPYTVHPSALLLSCQPGNNVINIVQSTLEWPFFFFFLLPLWPKMFVSTLIIIVLTRVSTRFLWAVSRSYILPQQRKNGPYWRYAISCRTGCGGQRGGDSQRGGGSFQDQVQELLWRDHTLLCVLSSDVLVKNSFTGLYDHMLHCRKWNTHSIVESPEASLRILS